MISNYERDSMKYTVSVLILAGFILILAELALNQVR